MKSKIITKMIDLNFFIKKRLKDIYNYIIKWKVKLIYKKKLQW